MAAIAIIGGGLSGTLTALHLIRMNSATPLAIYLVDKHDRVGPGLAYSTRRSCHRLNVRAGALSIFAEDPGHFVRWLAERGGSGDPGEYALRETFGYYIEDQMREHSAQHGPAVLRVINDEATGCRVHSDGATVVLQSGAELDVQHVVLAVGNFPPARFAPFSTLQSDSRYIADPWAPGAMERMAACSRLLFIGTGLTMVDVALGLDELGFSGQMTALSRHGLLPAVHTSPHEYPAFLDEMREEATILHMMRTVRRHVREAAGRGIAVQVVIDSLRPHIQKLWMTLPGEERRRFLRHVRHYWDNIRHRMAPRCGSDIGQLKQAERLQIIAGTVSHVVPHDDTFSVEYRRRGEQQRQSMEVEGIINCTGPAQDYSRIAHPLIADLMQRGVLCCDPLHLGINAMPDGRLIDSSGRASDILYTLGPPLRGVLWETTAVGEIRGQAAALASSLLAASSKELVN